MTDIISQGFNGKSDEHGAPFYQVVLKGDVTLDIRKSDLEIYKDFFQSGSDNKPYEILTDGTKVTRVRPANIF